MRLRSLFRIAVLAACVFPPPSSAQVRPTGDWRTIETPHFRVHFTAELAALAGRTAENAELAYSRLAAELAPPRGIVDIVLADNVDYSNGYATVFPTNRIVLFARPPVDVTSLRHHADWNLLLVTHELVHIFHLDRSKGWWGFAQRIFGRAPALFPNTYAPSWITEGLAVHYESRYGIGGRLRGSDFPAHVRAEAREGQLPTLDALSLAAPRYPDAASVYIYGSYAITHDAPRAMRSFVERSSERVIPWLHESNARYAFGERFSTMWSRWRDSVMRAESGDASSDARELTRHPFTASHPRYLTDSTLVYLASDGRATTGLYSLTRDGRRDRIGRRASIDSPARLPDGRWLQAELEYLGPWSVRSDLTVGNGIGRRRVTRDQRISNPDVHAATARIVALRTDPGTTSIVEIVGREARTIAAGTLDRAWSEPRWSRDGTRIAAARWERGGHSSIVVLDESGAEQRAITPRGAGFSVVSSPVWEPGDTTLLFVSDHEGRAMVYRGDVRTGAIGLVWGTATALATPDVSPDGRRVAAVELRADGHRVVERELRPDVPLAPPAAGAAAIPPAAPDAVGDVLDRSERYDPFRYLRVSWWMPVAEQTGTGQMLLGAMTTGRDPVGRHAYGISAAWEMKYQEEALRASYTFAGLGNPLLSFDASTDWAHAPVFDNTSALVGYLARRQTRYGAFATLQRPRVRASSYLMAGGELEQSEYRTYPNSLLSLLDSRFEQRYVERSLVVAAGVSTLQRPILATSAADGITFDVQHRERADGGLDGEAVNETMVAASLARSLPLPGFARHVVALRGAYGVTGHRSAAGFGVGGVSGSSLELLPGIAIGSSARTFGVRGFPESRQAGVRAVAASAEYRAPLALIGRGLGLWPLFFQKTTLTGFVDSGAAWCSFEVADSYLCPAGNSDKSWMKSYGAELGIDAAVHYDWVYRFRLGIAHAYRGRMYAEESNVLYFSLGSSW